MRSITITRRRFNTAVMASAAVLPLLSARSASQDKKSFGANTKVVWRPLVTSGGGLVTHFDTHKDGTKVCGTDVGGAYVYNGAKQRWKQICSQPRMMISTQNGYRQQTGVADIRIAPSDSSCFYFFFRGEIWKSTNRGETSAQTNYEKNSSPTLDSNGRYKLLPKLGIDPTNSKVIYASNPGGYAKRSSDGGDTWQEITALPKGTAIGACCFVFDQTSGRTNNRTNVIYTSIFGDGVWKSDDAGLHWKRISSSIVEPWDAGVDAAGAYYVSYSSGSSYRVSKCVSGTWSTIRENASFRYVITTHSADPGRLCVMLSLNGEFSETIDGGATWVTYRKDAQVFSAGDAPWQAADINNGFSPSITAMAFDRSTANEIWVCLGQGILKATIAPDAPHWSCKSDGIEELVVNDIVHESGKRLLIAVWDEIGFLRETNSLTTSPTSHFLYPSINPIQHGFQFSRDPANLDYFVLAGGSRSVCGYSTDDGATFHTFASLPPGAPTYYSCICVNNGVIIWTQNSGSAYPFRSTDNGKSWTKIAVSFDSNSSAISVGWNSGLFESKKMIAADRVNPNGFYMTNWISRKNSRIRGVWHSTDAGLTWILGSQPYKNTSFYIKELKAVPGHEGWLFATCGYNSSPAYPQSGTGFYFSRDYGLTWAPVPATLGVEHFGYGKSPNNGGMPQIGFSGFVSGVYGIYRMPVDDPTTIVPLLQAEDEGYPFGINNVITAIEGDKDIFGRFYVGYRGAGTVYCDSTI